MNYPVTDLSYYINSFKNIGTSCFCEKKETLPSFLFTIFQIIDLFFVKTLFAFPVQ